MKKMIMQNKKRSLCLFFFISLCLLLLTPPALAWSENNYESKISATIDDRISIEAELNIPYYVGKLKLELPVEGNIKETNVYVVNPPMSEQLPSDEPEGYMASGGDAPGRVEVKLISADRPIYFSPLYPTGFEYDPETGFYGAYQSGDGYSSKEGGEISLFSGLNGGWLYFNYSLEPLGYDSIDDMTEEVKEENLYYFRIGAPYILVMYDEEIEYFLANGEIRGIEGYKWPGLRELLIDTPPPSNPSLNNFTVKNVYTQGQFIDISSQWYKDSVKKVYEIGLMKGNSDGNFNPEGTITLAEAITMAARLHRERRQKAERGRE